MTAEWAVPRMAMPRRRQFAHKLAFTLPELLLWTLELWTLELDTKLDCRAWVALSSLRDNFANRR